MADRITTARRGEVNDSASLAGSTLDAGGLSTIFEGVKQKRLDKARAKRDAKKRAAERRPEGPVPPSSRRGRGVEQIRETLGFAPRQETRLGVILGGSRFEGAGGPFCSLDVLDLDHAAFAEPSAAQGMSLEQRVKAGAPGLRRLSLKFLPHGMAINPRRPAESAWFEKWGPGAVYLDVAAGSLLRTISPLSAGHHFYGHGAFSPDASLLFAVETNLETRAGVISIRDPNADFKVVGEFPSFGQKPHDCVLLLEEGLLVVTNGGGPHGSEELANISFIEISSGKLVEQLVVEDRRRNAGHVAVDRQRNLAMVSAPREGLPTSEAGGVTLRATGRSAWTHVTEPAEVCARMLGESLSVCIDTGTDSAWVTNPSGNLLTQWRVSDASLIRELTLPSVRGVCLSLDESSLCVSHAAGAELGLLSPDTGVALPVQPLALRVFGGSHLYAWAYPA
ncbi:MAG: DUF1513 domain-containing protein [Polyangiaceae bacterium]|nr:DUF1513 domain-containing protein [Polyangiaceae bacterium]MCB9606034.1 DUF1513 domain-containing protein [Polyangiaceae bacterium]